MARRESLKQLLSCRRLRNVAAPACRAKRRLSKYQPEMAKKANEVLLKHLKKLSKEGLHLAYIRIMVPEGNASARNVSSTGATYPMCVSFCIIELHAPTYLSATSAACLLYAVMKNGHFHHRNNGMSRRRVAADIIWAASEEAAVRWTRARYAICAVRGGGGPAGKNVAA